MNDGKAAGPLPSTSLLCPVSFNASGCNVQNTHQQVTHLAGDFVFAFSRDRSGVELLGRSKLRMSDLKSASLLPSGPGPMSPHSSGKNVPHLSSRFPVQRFRMPSNLLTSSSWVLF